jgi:hypothetical protein
MSYLTYQGESEYGKCQVGPDDDDDNDNDGGSGGCFLKSIDD